MFVLAGVVSASAPTHIMFAFVDHFEPIDNLLPNREVTMWIDDYMTMAGRHTDADGRHPIHSYFVVCEPGITRDRLDATLDRLSWVTYTGYGEIELHLHHGLVDESVRTEEEATTEFLDILSAAKTRYNAHGALVTTEPSPRCAFGFIHGMWALDDSRLEWWPGSYSPHRAYCGVNRELDLLKENGCYADFTFPAWGSMNPYQRNSIFYASDDGNPASYQNGVNLHVVEVNQPPRNELMIIEGPTGNPNIGILPGSYSDWPSIFRMQDWVAQRIHVPGRDDWIFIKVHTHGCAGDLMDATVWNCFFGPPMDNFYSDIERYYNNGRSCQLHYVSAREMYNIVKAAEAGMTGDPGQYRDFAIPPYANMRISTPTEYRLVHYDPNQVVIETTQPTAYFDISLREFTEDAMVFEGNDPPNDVERCDALNEVGYYGELRIQDSTPSRYYWFVSPEQGVPDLSEFQPKDGA
jgi:hypothetical protein